MKQALLFLILLHSLTASAQRLSEHAIRERVVKTLKSIQQSSESKPRSSQPFGMKQTLVTDNGNCHVYDINGGGFVIAPADAQMPAVLAYSYKSSTSEALRNPVFGHILQTYSNATPACATNQQLRRADLPDAVKPLITDTWHQYEPFWQQTPVVDGKQCLTGCVAHAMAEVMYYYRHPQRGTGSYTYTDSTGCGQTLTANFGEHTYDWDNILDSYIPGQYTQQQADAVALLISDCGIAVDMKYTPDASGAHPIAQPLALVNYFDYDRGIQQYFRDFFTWNEWNDMLMTELAEGRPILMSGYSAGQAHAYVCDGYDTQGFYHLNWGWEGEANGYYNIQYMSPDLPPWHDKDSPEKGLNLLQVICTGIKPATATPATESHIFALSAISSPDSIVPRQSSFRVVTSDLSNIGWNLHTGRVSLALKSGENITAILHDYTHEFLLEEVDDTTYTDTLTISIPAETTNGTYRIVPVFHDNGQWKEARTSIGTPNSLSLEVTDQQIKITPHAPSAASLSIVSLDFPDTLIKQSNPAYTVTIRNNGAEFCGRLYFCLQPLEDPSRQLVFSEQGVTLLPGEETTRHFHTTYFDMKEGLYKLRIYNDLNLFNDSLALLNSMPEKTVRVVPQSVGINGIESTTGYITVHTLTGITVATIKDNGTNNPSSAIRQQGVPSGIYIVRHKGSTYKIAVSDN